jgi:UMF1 family MFS transporter
MTTASMSAANQIDEQTYKRRIWAWTMYDWANSAFATTIMAAVLPVYFSQVAGATLPSATVATTYWSTGLSVSLLITAIISPILGTISDVMRGKKRFLSIFVGIGIISTALLVMVETGDWVLAAILGIAGRIGFSGANTFYDALLPHVAKEEDQDRVSARGYAMGYLGGGLLLAINVVMILYIPGTWGSRLSFLSVAIWWGVFSIPLFRRVPEPPAATIKLAATENIISVSIRRIRDTFKDIRRYRELFKFLIAFLVYNDGIGTIIGMAAIYGAELGFGAVELILALLLVQFVGIPFSLIFGRLPTQGDKRRPFFLAFVLFNMVALPLVGIAGKNFLPAEITGVPPTPYQATAHAVGEGIYLPRAQEIQQTGDWELITVSAEQIGGDADRSQIMTAEADANIKLDFNGDRVAVTYSLGPDHGIWAVFMDEGPLLDPDTGQPMRIDAYNPTVRYEVTETFQADAPGEHSISLVNLGEKNAQSQGIVMTLSQVEVLPKARSSNLGVIIGIIIVLELLGLGISYLLGPLLFSNLAESLDTRRSIILALSVYSVVAIWAFFLNSTIEYWLMAWMVAVVQGGSQALSRSLYASLSPAAKSGEFFGFFGVMEKFSAILGPLIFAAAGIIFGSSRPAILSLIVLFILGGFLLTRVNIDKGKQIAQAEDAELLGRQTAF